MDRRRKLQATLDDLVAGGTPGIAAVLIRDGAVLEASAAGVGDLGTGARTTVDTVHLWFSMTKIVTATAVMQLVERGVLSLEDRVDRFVPEFPKPSRGWPPVEVRHLLSHSAGLANPIPVRWVHQAREQGRDPRAFAIELLARHKRLRFPAGTKASYSNLGYIALGEVVGAAAGQRFEDYVRSEILEPLSMDRTGFAYDGLPDDDVASGHQLRLSPMTPLFRLLLPRGVVGPNRVRFVAFNRFLVDGPAYGGLLGSPTDAARFMGAHLNGGAFAGVRILSPPSVETMQTIHASGRGIDVGFGWYRRGPDRTGDEPLLEHIGGGGGFWNMMRIYPERGLGVLAMGNATSYDHRAVARAAMLTVA